jgi:hypothetical protein
LFSYYLIISRDEQVFLRPQKMSMEMVAACRFFHTNFLQIPQHFFMVLGYSIDKKGFHSGCKGIQYRCSVERVEDSEAFCVASLNVFEEIIKVSYRFQRCLT